MKTASLVNHLLVATFLGGTVYGAHHLFEKGGAEAIARSYAPPYVPLSQDEAQSQARKNLAISTEKYFRIKERRLTDPCYLEIAQFDFEAMRQVRDCRLDLRSLPQLMKPTLDVTAVASRHWENYVQFELKPAQEKIEERGLILVQGMGALLGLWVAFVTLRWLKGTAIPNLQRGRIRLSNKLQVGRRIRSISEGHRLDKAKEKIVTLEKLRDSGLISETEFTRRKDLLRNSLVE